MPGTRSRRSIETLRGGRLRGRPVVGISVRLAIASVILALVMVLTITAYRVSIIGDAAVDDLRRYISRSVSAVSLPAGHVLWDLDDRGAELIVDGLLAQEATSLVRLADMVGVIRISKGNDRLADLGAGHLDIAALLRDQRNDVPFFHAFLIPKAPVVAVQDIMHPTRPDQILGTLTVVGSTEFLKARIDRELKAVVDSSLLLVVCFTFATIVVGYVLAARPLARLARAPALSQQVGDVSLSTVTLPDDLTARSDEIGSLSRAVLASLRSVAASAQVLAEQEALLSLAQSVGRIGHVYADLESGRTIVSDTAMQILELTNDDPSPGRGIGDLVRSLGDSPDIEAWAERAATAFASGRSFEGQAWFDTASGAPRYLHYQLESRSDDEGQRRGLMMIVQDVTEYARTSLEAQHRRDQLLRAEEVGDIGHWLEDADRGTVQLSPGAARLLELPAETVIAQSAIAERLRGSGGGSGGAPGDDKPDGTALPGASGDREFDLTLPSGRSRRVRIRAHGSVTDDRDGTPQSLTFVQDISDLYQARRQLEERTERLSEAQEIALLGAVRIDVAAGMVHVSPELSRLLDVRARDGSLSMPIEEYGEYFDAEELAALRRDAARAFERGEVAIGRVRFRPNVPGQERWLAYRMLPRFDEDGNVCERYGINRDITEQVRLEAEREQARTLLANVIEHASIDIAVRDPNGELLLANAGMRRKFAAWQSGDLDANLFAPVLGLAGPDKTPPDKTPPDEAAPDRAAADADTARKTLHVLRDVDGVARDYEVVTFPIRDDSGTLTAIGTLASDVSELKDAQRALEKANEGLEDLVAMRTKALQESEERYRAVAEASSDWFFELDRDLKIISCSPGFERVTGLPSDRVIGTGYDETGPDVEVVGPAERAHWQEAVRALSTFEPVRELRYWMRVGDGHRYMRTSGSPILRDGVAVGMRCGSTDLTEIRQVQDHLEETEKMASLGRLVAGVAHELNTPLGAARTVLSSLETRVAALRAAPDSVSRAEMEDEVIPRIQTGLRIASTGLERSVDLVQRFKQVAADRTNDTMRPFFLKEVIASNVEAIAPTMVGSNVSIEIGVPDGLELVGYPGPLGQVITNLIQNAWLHGFEGRDAGHIAIGARLDSGDIIEITVADDGSGIDEAIAPRIFEPFFTTKIGAGGTGLGLSIVFNIVTGLLGGRIAVRPSAANGTLFVIRIPRIAPEGGDRTDPHATD